MSSFISQDSNNDQQVRATGNDAALSKVSAATKGYLKDPFIHLFVEPSKRTFRRAPLINRGYYARAQCIDQIVLSFLQHCNISSQTTTTSTTTTTTPTAQATTTSTTSTTAPLNTSCTAQIITLGAGSDTLYFRLCTSHPELARNLAIFETDFQQVVDRKQQICQGNESLRAIASNENYNIFPCDLRDLNTVTNGLEKCGFDPNKPTLLLSECVLIYMESEYSNSLIEWAATQIPTSIFVTYEQIKPNDAFGAMMVRNIKQRGCPLKSIHKYPTLKSLKDRYEELGYKDVKIRDMNDVYYNFIDNEDRARIEKIELFDELEEWHLIQGHYCLAVAVNDDKMNSEEIDKLHNGLEFF